MKININPSKVQADGSPDRSPLRSGQPFVFGSLPVARRRLVGTTSGREDCTPSRQGFLFAPSGVGGEVRSTGRMASVYIPVQGTEEEVRVALDQLPHDASDIVDILKAEQAPLHLWLIIAVSPLPIAVVLAVP
jgi:hypothetical protein